MKKIFMLAVAAAVLVPAGWFANRILRAAVEHSLVRNADKDLAAGDYRNASIYLRRALSMNPVDANASRLMADLCEDTGSPTALGWRIRTAQLETNNAGNLLAWAKTALKQNDLTSAALALNQVEEKSRSTARFHELTGSLAWNVHDTVDAEKEFTEALQFEPTNQALQLNLATVQLVSTNSTLANTGRHTLENFPADSPLHLTAIRYLATDAFVHKSYDQALAYSRRVVADPKSTYADKLALLHVLRDAKSPEFTGWENNLKAEAVPSPHLASALGEWLQKEESPAVALAWLQSLPSNTQTNYPVPLTQASCLIALRDWNGLMSVVQKEDWGQQNYYRLALESLASRNLDQKVAADAAWREAFDLSVQHLDRLVRLNEFATGWGWNSERCKVLEKISLEYPEQTWADRQLLGLLYANGQTQTLVGVLDRMSSADPTDYRLKSDLAKILMLERTEPEKAHRLALESYNNSTNNPYSTCTYAYSLLLQSKPAEAVKVLDSVDADALKNPSIAALYGVVEAKAGNKDVARAPLKLAESGQLLPEEKELVREVASQP